MSQPVTIEDIARLLDEKLADLFQENRGQLGTTLASLEKKNGEQLASPQGGAGLSVQERQEAFYEEERQRARIAIMEARMDEVHRTLNRINDRIGRGAVPNLATLQRIPRRYHTATELHSAIKSKRRRLGYMG